MSRHRWPDGNTDEFTEWLWASGTVQNNSKSRVMIVQSSKKRADRAAVCVTVSLGRFIDLVGQSVCVWLVA